MQIGRTLLLLSILAQAGFAQNKSVELERNPAWPEIWGDIGLRGFVPSERVAPNGLVFDPVFESDAHFNLGLLPQKKLYLFVDGDFWAQRAEPGVTHSKSGNLDFSKRECDIDVGLAWTPINHVEFRGAFFSFNNLNRGASETIADKHQDGALFSARYYFSNPNAYDTGRLSFVGLGFYPGNNLIGGGGDEFAATLFAQLHMVYELPALRSYFYGDIKLTAEEAVQPRLFNVDFGLAARPFLSLPNFEFRLGNEIDADIKDHTTRDLFYGGVRTYFGGGTQFRDDEPRATYEALRSPEVWGHLGLNVFPAGHRIAPNGVEFTPLLMSDLDFNLGLLPRHQLYVFGESDFWAQRASATGVVPSRDQADNDVNAREWDLLAGIACALPYRFELRGAFYMQNNLNRGGSTSQVPDRFFPSGFNDGWQVRLRYYFSSENLYDPSRRSFVEAGYYPSRDLVGGDGNTFRPGAFARAYLSYDVPRLMSYVYGTGTFIAERDNSFRLMILNGGVAFRPFHDFANLEFRVGNELTRDFRAESTRNLTYGAIRINFSTR